MHYRFNKSNDCYEATIPGAKIKNEDDDDDYPLFVYDSDDDYVFSQIGMKLEYNSHNNNLKIMGCYDVEEFWSLKELRKHCKNLIETYNQFVFYKKQFGANKQIVKMNRDFE